MKITVSQLRRLVRESVLKEMLASQLPTPVTDVSQTQLGGLMQKLAATFDQILTNQIIVSKFPAAKTMDTFELNTVLKNDLDKHVSASVEALKTALTQTLNTQFQQALGGFKPSPGANVEAQGQRPATGARPDQRSTIAPPRMP